MYIRQWCCQELKVWGQGQGIKAPGQEQRIKAPGQGQGLEVWGQEQGLVNWSWKIHKDKDFLKYNNTDITYNTGESDSREGLEWRESMWFHEVVI